MRGREKAKGKGRSRRSERKRGAKTGWREGDRDRGGHDRMGQDSHGGRTEAQKERED